MNNIVIAALYHFVTLDNFQQLKSPLLKFCMHHNIKGTLLLAHEGINGTIAGSRTSIDKTLQFIKDTLNIPSLQHKESFCSNPPFYRMKVKLKKEIVTLGIPGVNPNQQTGEYVEPKDWNDLIADPNVIVIDTRNEYEVDIGTFKNALNPKTTTFRELPNYIAENFNTPEHKNKKIAMFCTGGIRCEKSTAMLIQQGFKNVYHLQGGILNYLEKIPKQESLWQGECFVFDNRVAVKDNLEPGTYDQCHGCRHPISLLDRQSEHYKAGVHCPHCYATATPKKINRAKERHKQMVLATKQNKTHLGNYIKHSDQITN